MKFVRSHHKRALFTISLLAFIFTLHANLPTYVGSSFLNKLTDVGTLSLIYSAGSLVTILCFLAMPSLLRRIGNYEATLLLVIVQAIALLGMVFVTDITLVSVFFLASLIVLNLISFTLDVFLENNSDDIHTGGIRGLFLTVVNIAWILSPMLAGALVGKDNYRLVFLGSVLLLVPFIWVLASNFRTFKDPAYDHLSARRALSKVWGNRNFHKICASNIILHFFYAWMIIYMPIYLHQTIGFDWESISIIFTIMLVPFVILELPLGRLADTRLGEKELLSLGYIIAAIATACLSFITTPNIWLWALVLFMTRVGISMVEIMNETYFFKKIDGSSSSVLTFFRITRPVAYVVAPLMGSYVIAHAGFQYLFVVLALVLLYGLRYSLTLKDTK